MGEHVRRARELAGIDVAGLSARTNLRPAWIVALENDEIESCGGVTYVRGHVRVIAKVLKVDPEDLLFDLEPAILVDHGASRRHGAGVAAVVFIVALIAVIGAVMWWLLAK